MTREHIFAEWVDRLYPEAASTKGLSIISRRDGSRKQYESLPFEQKVRVVCDKCNNKWMNALESAVAPTLGPMVLQGRATRLSPAIQQTVATWAIKTAFMIQHLHSTDRVVPDSEYHRFYAEQQPPPKYRVWLARRSGIVDETGMPLVIWSREQAIDTFSHDDTVTRNQVLEMAADGCCVYRITFTLGHVVFVIFGHTYPNDFRIQFSANMAQVIRRIWPVQERTTWPPPMPVEQMGGLHALHDVFNIPT